MFVVLWEFEVKLGSENRFEKVYGAQGEWADLFGSDRSYRETRLLRDAARALIYVTMDFWDTREAYEKFVETHSAEYQALDTACQRLTQSERRIADCQGLA